MYNILLCFNDDSRDIAARNCLVTGDLRIKIGDYGASIQTYKVKILFFFCIIVGHLQTCN